MCSGANCRAVVRVDTAQCSWVKKTRRGSNLQVGHGHAVQHVVAGLLDGTEQVVEGADVDARLLVRSQHGVGLPTTCRQGEAALLKEKLHRQGNSLALLCF